MYHQAHIRSAMWMRDSASFPYCSEFHRCYCKERLLGCVCACRHELGWYPLYFGMRQSSLIRQFSPKRTVHFCKSGCFQSQGCECQLFCLKEDFQARRKVPCSMQEENFGGSWGLDYRVEIHRWVQEALSLLVRFNTGSFPCPGKWADVQCDKSLFLQGDRNLDVQSESTFSLKHQVSEEFANGDLGRAPQDKYMAGNVYRKAGGGDRASCGGCRCHSKRKDGDAGYEVSAQWTDHDSSSPSPLYSSSERRNNRGRSQVRFTVQEKHFSRRQEQTESISRATNHHAIKKDVRNRASEGGHVCHDKHEDHIAGYEVSAEWPNYDSSSSSSSYSSSKRQQNIGRSQDKYGYEVSAQWADYDSSSSSSSYYSSKSYSSKRRQNIRRSQDKFTVHDEHLSSRRHQTESTLRASHRHGGTKGVSSEAEGSFTAHSIRTPTRQGEQITREDQHSNKWNRENKQEIIEGDQYFSKRDEIKVCVGEEESCAAFSRTAEHHGEQQIQMKQEDFNIERRNDIRDSSVSSDTYSNSYRHGRTWDDRHKESYGDGQAWIGVTKDLKQRHDSMTNDDMDYDATCAPYRYKGEERVLVNERQGTSMAVGHSAQHSNQTQVNQISNKPILPHCGSSIIVVDSDLSRINESKDYVCKHCGSCIVDSSTQASTSRNERDIRTSQEQIPTTQVPVSSSSQFPPRSYPRTSADQKMSAYTTSDYIRKHNRLSNVEYRQEVVTGSTPGDTRTSEPTTLRQEQISQPSEPRPGSSSKFTGTRQSDRPSTSVLVAKDSQFFCTSGSQEEATPSGRISLQGVSIHPSPSETYGNHQLPGYVTNDYVRVHHHSEKVDYQEEASTSLQIGAAIQGHTILQDSSAVPSSSKMVLHDSLGTATADNQSAGYIASEYIGKHHQSSNMEYMQKGVADGTPGSVRISDSSTFQEGQKSQPSDPRPGSSSRFTGPHRSGQLETSVFVAKDSHSLSTSSSREEALLLGWISPQEDSIHSPPLETYGAHQSPHYAIKNHVHHSVDVDYKEEFNTSTQTGAFILGQVTLQESSVPSSSKLVLQGSVGTAAADHQPVYTSIKSFTRTSQIGSHVRSAEIQSGSSRNQSETGNTRNNGLNKQSEPHIEGSDLSSVIFLGKSSHETKESSIQLLPQASLPSQRILQTTEKICQVERESKSDQISVLQQVALANPSSVDSEKSSTCERSSRNYGMQSSWQSPASSETRGPPDEMWDVSGETFEELSGVEILEATEPSVSVASGEKLTEETATAGTVSGTSVATSSSAIVKRTSKSLWGYLAEIVKVGWVLRMGSHDSTPKFTPKSSSNESRGTEAWFSGYEPEDEEKMRREKKDGLKEPTIKCPSDEIISELNLKQGQEITEGGNVQAKITNAGLAMSSVGFSERRSIRRRASSLSENQKQDSAANSAYVTSSTAAASGKTSLDIITSSAGTTDIQKLRETSEVGSSFVLIPDDSLTGMQEPPIKGGPGAASKEHSETTLRQSKLKRAAQVQRERFEAWEEAYRLESQQRKMDEMFMREALQEARKAADIWEVPVGAVLVQDGKIIARGCNLVEELRDATAHAELICIREASNTLKSWRLAGTTLYVTLEPCAMCAGAILQARIDALVWGAPNKLLGADGSWVRLFNSPDGGQNSLGQPSTPASPVHPFHPNMKIRRGILETDCSDVLQQFFQLKSKKARMQESPPSCMPLANPPKFFSKIPDFFGMMFCL